MLFNCSTDGSFTRQIKRGRRHSEISKTTFKPTFYVSVSKIVQWRPYFMEETGQIRAEVFICIPFFQLLIRPNILTFVREFVIIFVCS